MHLCKTNATQITVHDQYSAGVFLYTQFSGDQNVAIMYIHVHDQPGCARMSAYIDFLCLLLIKLTSSSSFTDFLHHFLFNTKVHNVASHETYGNKAVQ